MKRSLVFAAVGALLLAGCGEEPGTQPAGASAGGASAAAVSAAAVSAVAVSVDLSIAVAEGTPTNAALWVHPTDVSRSLVVGADGDAGLALYGIDGQLQEHFGTGPSDFVAITYGFDIGARPAALVVAWDRVTMGLRAWDIDAAGTPRDITGAPLPVNDELTGLCTYRSGLSGKHYAFAATDAGTLQQWELSAQRGAVHGRLVRSIPVGAGIAQCAADDAAGVVYVADETVGIWRIGAEPEADPADRELVDLVPPQGQLGEEVKGLAIHAARDAKYLLAADEEASGVHVYALPEGQHIGLVKLAGVEGATIEVIAAAGFGPGALQSGFVLAADEDGDGGPAYRLLKWDAISAALQLPAATPLDPRAAPAATARTVKPTVETEPVDDFGDAADDAAIWVHPTDPGMSLVIASQKKRGIEVYDLAGVRVQMLPIGRVNNVDVRQGVMLGGKKRDIVLGSNREQKLVALYEVDAAARRLVDALAAPIPAGMRDPYGVCLYHSAQSGKLYAFMNNSDDGAFRQWEIEAAADGMLTAKVVREFTVGTQAEGCAADDETGALYIAEEDVGLWRYGAEPDAGTARTQLDATGDAGRLTADVEGVGIYRGTGGAGYLVVSNQGADNFAVYRREGANAFVGYFSIVANDELGIDGASETDGLAVTSTALGDAFPQGLLVVQDGRNITPAERQNFKLVRWEHVAGALGL